MIWTGYCPHCKKRVTKGVMAPLVYGSPMTKCQYCGKDYINYDYIELGMVPENRWRAHEFLVILVRLGKMAVRYMMVWAVAGVVLSNFGVSPFAFWVVAVMLVLLAMWAVLTVRNTHKELSEERSRSLKRLKKEMREYLNIKKYKTPAK